MCKDTCGSLEQGDRLDSSIEAVRETRKMQIWDIDKERGREGDKKRTRERERE